MLFAVQQTKHRRERESLRLSRLMLLLSPRVCQGDPAGWVKSLNCHCPFNSAGLQRERGMQEVNREGEKGGVSESGGGGEEEFRGETEDEQKRDEARR